MLFDNASIMDNLWIMLYNKIVYQKRWICRYKAMSYSAAEKRYDLMEYRRCGESGLRLPALSLGLWHNFGEAADYSNCRNMVLSAFDSGITHFDAANNYGPPPGCAERTLGRILKDDLKAYRDEIVISTKAGYDMWPGPYGNWGSRKYLIASLDQSLERMGLDYVDIFYHHRPDPETPLEETASALVDIVRSGKALYAGISNYGPEATKKMCSLLQKNGIHCLIHQMKLSLLDTGNLPLLDTLEEEGVGGIAFSPLRQGILTGKYLAGIPAGSRADGNSRFLKPESLTPDIMETTGKLAAFASQRGNSLAQIALMWVLSQKQIASVVIGARSPEQIRENIGALSIAPFTAEELQIIDEIIGRAKRGI